MFPAHAGLGCGQRWGLKLLLCGGPPGMGREGPWHQRPALGSAPSVRSRPDMIQPLGVLGEAPGPCDLTRRDVTVCRLARPGFESSRLLGPTVDAQGSHQSPCADSPVSLSLVWQWLWGLSSRGSTMGQEARLCCPEGTCGEPSSGGSCDPGLIISSVALFACHCCEGGHFPGVRVITPVVRVCVRVCTCMHTMLAALSPL